MNDAFYILQTDHKYGYNDRDAYIKLEAVDLFSAMLEVERISKFDENLYCSTIFEYVPYAEENTGVKTYMPVVRNYGHGGFYPAGSELWDANYYLTIDEQNNHKFHLNSYNVSLFYN